MSRIGKRLITLPSDVTLTIDGTLVTVKGPKGELRQELDPRVTLTKGEDGYNLTVADEEDKKQRSLWGLYGALIKNMIVGVKTDYRKELEINGVGFKAALQGKKIILNVGFSHPVEFDVPEGVTAVVEKTNIVLTGIDKQLVGETAARIRRIRKPEPYKGKGIKYSDEIIRRKAGKTATSK